MTLDELVASLLGPKAHFWPDQKAESARVAARPVEAPMLVESQPAGATEQGLNKFNHLIELATAMGGIGPANPNFGSAPAKVAPSRARPGLGFPNNPENRAKGFEESKYKFEQPVKVTFPDGSTHTDIIKGLNKAHALERAKYNWEGATIKAIERSEVE